MANIELTLQRMAEANTARQMEWQEKMSKTSHQMEVADLKSAGLNPVLSSNQGANSYTTSVDSAVNALAGIHQSKLSAAATKAAAAAQAAAMRDSASIAANAQLQMNKDTIEYNKWKTLNEPQSITKTIDKYVSKIVNNVSERNKYRSDIISNSTILRRAQKTGSTVSFSSLSSATKNRIDSALEHWNISRTSSNRSNYLKYLVSGNIFYLYKFK